MSYLGKVKGGAGAEWRPPPTRTPAQMHSLFRVRDFSNSDQSENEYGALFKNVGIYNKHRQRTDTELEIDRGVYPQGRRVPPLIARGYGTRIGPKAAKSHVWEYFMNTWGTLCIPHVRALATLCIIWPANNTKSNLARRTTPPRSKVTPATRVAHTGNVAFAGGS